MLRTIRPVLWSVLSLFACLAVFSNPAAAVPDLSVSKTSGLSDTSMLAPGDVIVWSISYANNGDQTASNVVLTETVPVFTMFTDGLSTGGWNCADGSPAGTVCLFPLGALPAGAGGMLDFAVATLAGYAGEPIANTVSIAGDGGDADLADNVLTDSIAAASDIPEPATVTLFAMSLFGIAALRRRRTTT